MKKSILVLLLLLIAMTGCSSLSIDSKPYSNMKSKPGVLVKADTTSTDTFNSLSEVLYKDGKIVGFGNASMLSVDIMGHHYDKKNEKTYVLDETGRTIAYSDLRITGNNWLEFNYNKDNSIKDLIIKNDSGTISTVDFEPYVYTSSTVTAVSLFSPNNNKKYYNTFVTNENNKVSIIMNDSLSGTSKSKFEAIPVFNEENQLIAYTTTRNTLLDIDSSETKKYCFYDITYNLNGVIIKIKKAD